MTAKLGVLGFSLVMAVSAPALAHEQHGSTWRSPSHVPQRKASPAPTGARTSWAPERSRDISLQHSDDNRDGWVTLDEALDRGRFDFRRSDRDRNRVLTRREVDHGELARHDRNRDGRMSLWEHQSAVRAHFARLDRNRDGYLARYELDPRVAPIRRTGWSR